MQIVSSGDNLLDISNPIYFFLFFGKLEKNISTCSLLEMFTQSVRCKLILLILFSPDQFNITSLPTEEFKLYIKCG